MVDTETLSPEAEAYFSSQGETIPTAEENAAPEPETAEIEAVADDEIDAGGAEDVPEAEGEGKDKPTGQSRVPLAALTKTREELKAEKRAREAVEAEAKVLRERWDQLLAAQQPQQPEKPAEEKLVPAQDPLGVLNALVEEREQARADREAQERREAEEREQQQFWNQTLDHARVQFQEASKEDAGFDALYIATRESIGKEYMDLYGFTEQQAIAAVNDYEAQQIAYATQRGINVAEHLRKIAKARGVSAPKPAAAEDATEELDRIEKGVTGSTSLSASSGGRTTTMTRETIANMSPSEFSAWLTKNGDAGFRKLAGG